MDGARITVQSGDETVTTSSEELQLTTDRLATGQTKRRLKADPQFDAAADKAMTSTGRQLKAVIERIERLETEKKEVSDQIKEVYAEAKGGGFDAKTIRKIVSLRKKSVEEREEEQALLDLYLSSLGMA